MMPARHWVVFFAVCVAVGVSVGWLSIHLEVVAVLVSLAAVVGAVRVRRADS